MIVTQSCPTLCDSMNFSAPGHPFRRQRAKELMWYWRRCLRVPWTGRRSNQSIFREINPEYSLEGQILKLKLQYFGHWMGTVDSLEKSLMLAKIEGKRRRGHQRIRWLDGITNSVDMNLGTFRGMMKETGRPGMLQSKGSQRVGHSCETQQQQHSHHRKFLHNHLMSFFYLYLHGCHITL